VVGKLRMGGGGWGGEVRRERSGGWVERGRGVEGWEGRVGWGRDEVEDGDFRRPIFKESSGQEADRSLHRESSLPGDLGFQRERREK